MMDAATGCLVLNAASTLYLTGLIWIVQRVVYPAFRGVDPARFAAFEIDHQRRITPVVAPAMIVELITSALLIILRPATVPMGLVTVGASLVLVIWASTFLLQVPLHGRLAQGHDARTIDVLIESNWIRTIAWTLRALIVLWCTGLTLGTAV